MDKNDLKLMWREAHIANIDNPFAKVSIEKSMGLKHNKLISGALSDIRLKLILYAILLVIYLVLMIYAFVYLRLKLSVNALVPLTLAGIFLLITATSEFVRLSILTKTADNLSLKDSMMSFRRKLKRIKLADFVFCLVFFYLLAFIAVFNYLTDIGGVKNLSGATGIVPVYLLAILILMLLSVPWLIKYQNNLRYKKLESNLKESAQQLNVHQSDGGL